MDTHSFILLSPLRNEERYPNSFIVLTLHIHCPRDSLSLPFFSSTLSPTWLGAPYGIPLVPCNTGTQYHRAS